MKPAVVVVRPGALGDTILTQPAIAALRARQPGRRVVLIGNALAGQLLVDGGDVDALLSVDDALALFANSEELDTRLAAAIGPVDSAVVYLSESRSAAAALARLGAREVAAGSPHPPEGTHIVDHLLALPGAPPGASPRLATGRVDSRGHLVLCLGAGSPSRVWPLERFADVASAWDGPVVVAAGPAERDRMGAIERLAVPIAMNLSVRALRGLLAGACCVVAGDTGPGHLAAAVGTPVVSLFGPSDPAMWAPRGPTVQIVRSSDGTMSGISADAVLEAARSLRR